MPDVRDKTTNTRDGQASAPRRENEIVPAAQDLGLEFDPIEILR